MALARLLLALTLFAAGYLLLVAAPTALLLTPPLTLAGIPWPVVLQWTVGAGLGLLAALLALDWLTGAAVWVPRFAPGARRIDYPPALAGIAERLSALQRPALYLSPGDGIQAYAVPGALAGAVVVTAGVLRLPADEQRWVFGHELSHLRHGDSEGALLWINAIRALGVAMRAVAVLHVAVFHIPLLGRSLAAILRLYLHLGGIVLQLLRTAFLLADRHLSRRMELRADRDGCRYAPSAAGARLLLRLGRPLEPGFGVLSTHPPTEARIQRLMEMRP